MGNCSCVQLQNKIAPTKRELSYSTRISKSFKKHRSVFSMRAEAGDSRTSLTTYDFEAWDEQLRCLYTFQDEMQSFFHIWKIIMLLDTKEWEFFCSTFYHSFSEQFINDYSDAFISHNAVQQGSFILKKINTCIVKLQTIFGLLDQQKENEKHAIKMDENGDNASIEIVHFLGPATHFMNSFQLYYEIHIDLGLNESMFSETYQALHKAIEVYPDINFNHDQLNSMQICFDVIDYLMRDNDLLELRYSVNKNCTDNLYLIQNQPLISLFVDFFDTHFVSMKLEEQQLFSLRIYSWLMKLLQDKEMDDTKNSDTDAIIMSQFHKNNLFGSEFSIGIVSLLDHLIYFLQLNQPKELYSHLIGIKKRYELYNTDIFEVFLPAFKQACFEYPKFQTSGSTIIDYDLEQAIDFVIALFMKPLMESNDEHFTNDLLAQHTNVTHLPIMEEKEESYNSEISTISTSQETDRSSNFFALPIAINKTSQYIQTSLGFWSNFVRNEDIKTKLRLSDKILETIHHTCTSKQYNMIDTVLANIGTANVNIIDMLDILFMKIEHNIHSVLYDESVTATQEKPIPVNYDRISGSEPIQSYGVNFSIQTYSTDYQVPQSNHNGDDITYNIPQPRYTNITLGSLKGKNSRITLNFSSLEQDLLHIKEFHDKYCIHPSLYQVLRKSVIMVLRKYYGAHFTHEIQKNFILLLRSMTALVLQKNL